MGDVNWGQVGGAAATGAGIGAATGNPIVAGAAALVAGGISFFRQKFGRDPTEAEQAQAAELAAGQGADLTNHLAALDYSEGLTQQQSQNAREAGFYSQAAGNFDIANAAQSRDAPQVLKNQADEQRQLEALNRTNQSGQQLTSTGNLLTDLGTRPMGDSYAEAQLRQGQNAAMAQQLSMARSGRSLGSGQASMNNAAFNNAALNQQTNQAAAIARIQEQNAYNQFQANALGQAGNQYGSAGTLAGQAGNQATTVRTGNEGLQKTNADLLQNQQATNNQTSQIYNTLGSQQQGLGMDANRLGTNAFQFGSQQGANKQIAQLNANVGQTSSNTAVALANAEADRAREAGAWNAGASGLAAGAELLGKSGAQAKADAGTFGGASPATPTTPPASDERNKTGITPLDVLPPPSFVQPRPPVGLSSPKPAVPERTAAQKANDAIKYKGMSPEQVARVKAADEKAAADWAKGIVPEGPAMDEDTRKIAVEPEPPTSGPQVASYVQTINALNNAYRPSQFAPADILNHVPGAGSGHSDSQNDVIARMKKKPGLLLDTGATKIAPALNAPAQRFAADPTRSISSLIHPGWTPSFAQPPAPPTPASADPGSRIGASAGGPRMVADAPAPAPRAWGDVFNAPALSDPVSLYLQGYDPYIAPPPTPVAPTRTVDSTKTGGGRSIDKSIDSGMPGGGRTITKSAPSKTTGGGRSIGSGIELKKDIVPIGSDDRSKDRIRELEGQLEALGGPPREGETTRLSPEQQKGFPAWLSRNGVRDLDNPDAHYDYRGAYLAGEGRGAGSEGHFTDTFKQHGHPSFSIESQYSRNANDGGSWEGDRFSPAVQPRAPDLEALDAAYARSQRPEGVDFRNAHGYSYEYKNPKQPGAAPGRQVGTMAQELEQTDAAPYVHDTPSGKTVDTSRLPLALAPAIGHTQRRVDDLERQLDALKGSGLGSYQPGLYPSPRSPY